MLLRCDDAHFVVYEEFSEKAQILAIQLQRQHRIPGTHHKYSRAAVPHQSPTVYSCLSDIPSVRVVKGYRRMTDISKINQWAVELTECRSQLALFLIYLKQSYIVRSSIMVGGVTYIAYPDSTPSRLDYLRSCTIEYLLIGLEFT